MTVLKLDNESCFVMSGTSVPMNESAVRADYA